jgi:UDP-N-acetylglucosamine transferase subunit ALG13
MTDQLHPQARLRHALVTPARDEAESLRRLAASIAAQTQRPAEWIIVDDGSEDGTAETAAELAEGIEWIKVLRLPPGRGRLAEGRRQGRDLHALEAGFAVATSRPQLVTKLDADVSLPPDYLERVGAAFAADPELGIASGSRCEPVDGTWRQRHLTGTSVEAQARTYRYECWCDVTPLEPRLGWDGVDEVTAILHGWRTLVIRELRFRHHRNIGDREGRLRARLAEGEAAHYMGYRISYLAARAAWHAREELAALAIPVGYLLSGVRRRSRCPDPAVRAHVRRRQSPRRLLRTWAEARGRPAEVERPDLLMVCSGGGHLMDLLALREAWGSRSRVWISLDRADVLSLLDDERVLLAHGPTNRNVPNLLRNLRMAWQVLDGVRPRVVLTSGAGVAVPFAWVAWLRGARVVYLECAGRVDRPSLSGRMIAPIASRTYAQWPELAELWPAAAYAGNVLQLPRERPDAGAGRAGGIFVTVGTNEARFDRLVRAAAVLAEGERVVLQRGSSRLDAPCTDCRDFMTYQEICDRVREARVVVTHAGVGSICVALQHGKRPIVVPRLKAFGEAVDDHQLQFARRLAAQGLVCLVEDAADLPAAVASAVVSPVRLPEPDPDLRVEIGAAVGELLAAA